MRSIFFSLFVSCFLLGCATSGVIEPASSTEQDTSMMIVPDRALKTTSGFAYVVLKEGNGRRPERTDAVKMHIRVHDVEGHVTDDETASLAVSHSTPFFEEMIAVMEVGSTIRVWGESSSRIWDLELVEIDETYRAPEDVSHPPEDAQTLEGFEGVRWRVIEQGKGENAKRGQTLRVQASRWTGRGEILESNRASRGMLVFLNDESRQFDPIHDALFRQLNEGAHARIWIPESLLSTGYDLVEDVWVVEFVTELDTPSELAIPSENRIEIAPDGAWVRFLERSGAALLKENDAATVHMTCWNTENGQLLDSSDLRDKPDIMDITPALGVWFEIMKHVAPGDVLMAWVKASVLPEQVNVDMTCRVAVTQAPQ